MGSLILKLALQYLESHPEQIVELIGEGVQAAVHALKAHNSQQAAAK